MRTSTLRLPLLVLSFSLLLALLPDAMAQRFEIFGLTNKIWKYDSTNDWYTPTGNGWTATNFNDSAWPSGRAILSSDANTVIVPLRGTQIRDLRTPVAGVPGSTANQAVYFRAHFDWPSNASPASQLILTCRIDDGVAVYLNGNRVGDLRMADTQLAHGSFTENAALVPCQDASGNNDGTCDEVITIDGTFLVNGDNVLAVTVHQNNATSSDITWGCKLEGVIPFAPRILDSTQPTNRTVVQSRSTTLLVVAEGSPPPTYQWFKDNVAIDPVANPTATNSALVISRMSSADAGDYYAVVNNPLGTTNSRTATVAYQADTAAPRPLRAVGSPTFDKIYIEYDEVLDSTTSTDGVNYAISPPLAQTADPLMVLGGNVIVLSTDPQSPGTLYTVTITDVYDLATNNITAPNNTADFQAWVNTSCSGVLFEAYDTASTPGNAVALLTAHPNFPNNPRDSIFIDRFFSRAAYPDDSHEQYGARMRTLFIPLVSGNWRFYHSSDDAGELWLNPSGSGPAGRMLIARENGCCNIYQTNLAFNPIQTSAPIPLTGGQAYYLEMLYKEGGGGDWGMAAARLDGFGFPAGGNNNAAGEYLNSPTMPSPFCVVAAGTVPAGASGSLTITQQPTDRTNQANTRATFTVAATTADAPFICYQWQRSDDGGGTFNDIAGATGTSYTTPYLTEADDNNDRYRLRISVPGQTVTSAEARLTVTADTVRPRVTRVLTINDTNIVVFFSEPLPGQFTTPPGTGDDPTAYQVDDGTSIIVGTAVISTSNPLRIDLYLSSSGLAMTYGNTYTLTVSTDVTPILDAYNNLIDPNPTVVTFLAQNFSGNVENLVTLSTNNMLAAGSLTDRGFAARLIQISPNIANANAVTEQMLAGVYPSAGAPSPNIAPVPIFWETNSINYNRDAPGGTSVGSLTPDVQFPGYPPGPTTPESVQNNMAMEVITYLHLQPGIYQFGVNSDDGFTVSPALSAEDPNDATILGEFDGGRGTADTLFSFCITHEGLYPFRLTWEQGQGGGNVEWWAVNLNSGSPTRNAINVSPAPDAYTPGCTAKSLTVAISGGNLIITWPSVGGGNLFGLQSTPSLTSPVWSWVSQIPQQSVDGNKRVTIPLGGSNEFYRLYKAAPPACP